ncbi:MAG: FHA domain-containing protein [Acidobacteriota bacterium]|nr:FHA domain-containing protein [Acidobacteriota bacterium]
MAQYRFGKCVFDPGRRQLTRAGTDADLSPRAFRALSLLLARYPDAVSKEELYQELWPDTIVELTNLNNVIVELRAAIGDKEKRMLRTKHRFGYVFAGPVDRDDQPGAAFVLLVGKNSFLLREGMNIVGRTPDAAVMIDSPAISRRHAAIEVVGTHAFIEDLGSKNGTSVDGEPINARHDLTDGATVCFGSVCGVFRAVGSGLSTLTEH